MGYILISLIVFESCASKLNEKKNKYSYFKSAEVTVRPCVSVRVFEKAYESITKDQAEKALKNLRAEKTSWIGWSSVSYAIASNDNGQLGIET